MVNHQKGVPDPGKEKVFFNRHFFDAFAFRAANDNPCSDGHGVKKRNADIGKG